MTGTDDITLVRDNAAKKFSWCILPGKSMTSVRSESSFGPQAGMPPKPADTSTEEQSPKHSAIWRLCGVTMPRPTLNQCLQSYFRRMQHVMARISHPLAIHDVACSIVHSVNNTGLAGQPKLFAEALF